MIFSHFASAGRFSLKGKKELQIQKQPPPKRGLFDAGKEAETRIKLNR